MGIGDGAMVLSRAAIGIITFDRSFSNFIGYFLAISETRQILILDSISTIFVICYGRSCTIDCRIQCQHFCKLFSCRTQTILVIIVIPLLGDLKISQSVVICIGDFITGVGVFNSTRAGLTTTESGVFAICEFSLIECITITQFAFDKGICCLRRKVGETQVPLIFHFYSNSGTARCIVVITGFCCSGYFSIGDR